MADAVANNPRGLVHNSLVLVNLVPWLSSHASPSPTRAVKPSPVRIYLKAQAASKSAAIATARQVRMHWRPEVRHRMDRSGFFHMQRTQKSRLTV